MPYGLPVPPQLLRQFKDAGKGLSPRQAGERTIQVVLDHFRAEVTVLDRDGEGELFRLGSGTPSHDIHGVHVEGIGGRERGNE